MSRYLRNAAIVCGVVALVVALAACAGEVEVVDVIKEVPVEKEVIVETEVVKEVPVEAVVEREVVKEVPVEVVVEREVVKEVPVERVVEIEVVKEVTAEEEESADSFESGPVSLSAGEVDDNRRWDEYLKYRGEYGGPPIHDVDISERYTITVLDAHDRPVPNAAVSVLADQTPVFEGRTYASGQTLFFPRAFPETDGAGTFSLLVEKDGVIQALDTGRGQDAEWVVKLDLDASYDDRVALDVLFLLDSTGSMADEIDQIKSTLLSISERIHGLPSRPDLRFGMVAYRDRGDEFVTRVYDFDRDIQRFSQAIQGIHADGGDDYPESVNEALHVAVHKPEWRLDDAIRLVFLLGDAPPHLDYAQDYDYATEMMEANRLGIKVFPIASSGLDEQGEYVFRQVAQHTMGRFIFIVYGGGTSHSVGQYTVEQLDDLVVELVEEELGFLAEPAPETTS